MWTFANPFVIYAILWGLLLGTVIVVGVSAEMYMLTQILSLEGITQLFMREQSEKKIPIEGKEKSPGANKKYNEGLKEAISKVEEQEETKVKATKYLEHKRW